MLHILYYILLTLYAITVISVIGVVVSENRNPLKSLAWLTVLLLFPIGGIVLYIIFGRSIKNTRMISRRNRRRLKKISRSTPLQDVSIPLSDASKQHIRLGRNLCSAPYYEGNQITLFDNGKDKFDSLIDDLENAKYQIHLQYYIIHNDEIGHRIARILQQKARAGVKVRLIYDHVGSFKAGSKYFKRLREAGVDLHPFFKVTFPPFGTRINWRNHRKLAIIDGRIGYIGGMNIADRYVDCAPCTKWRDSHLRIVGPAVQGLQMIFAVDWNFMSNELIEDSIKSTNPRGISHKGGAGVQILTSGPMSQWSNIAYVFLKAIGAAQHRIFIQTPYFLPTEGLLRALQSAALSGIDVRIMIPQHADSWMLTHASKSYITECLQAGIKIYLYGPGMMHAKTLLVDHELASVGSANFDFRSFEHNFEANAMIYSPEFNAKLHDSFMRDIELCQRVYAGEWKHRPVIHKVAQALTRLMSPVL